MGDYISNYKFSKFYYHILCDEPIKRSLIIICCLNYIITRWMQGKVAHNLEDKNSIFDRFDWVKD